MSATSGPPYAPTTAAVGGVPTVGLDVPICAVFILLFIGGAVSHMTLFRRNMARDHKFIPSAVTFGFCMSRIIANAMRIAWACQPHSVSLGIAATIFVNAAIVLLFILNLIYAQRMLRAAHPHIGWAKPVSLFFKFVYMLVVVNIIMLITAIVQSFYTLNGNTRRIDRDIELYGTTCVAAIAFLPLPIVSFVLLFPRRIERIDKFGKGSWRAKAFIVGIGAVLLCLGASFRAATNWMPPRPLDDPAWYDSKACFYVFNFTIEIIVVYSYLLVRMDQRFHVPNGSSRRRHYRGPGPESDDSTTVQYLESGEDRVSATHPPSRDSESTQVPEKQESEKQISEKQASEQS
ncbi:hypothetical protein ASPZODRAFT_153292 [Penicilliopsis zonata CBS 506.65]|uniref:Uncharacterized protein n=1 Tax=Penicilliopsis zonata CBS 506.65 TaxID=1073090 RepID=A0A1L9SCW0_9EURO|nr:hypothetical protein ASPZODRAFT_153292 [Penicilliopsis zonata CBS 506.65]OJJ44968.1 hypothetical protein ASPZODRAFT_153292 [Penicilliopsis zonata CBS 506.65]